MASTVPYGVAGNAPSYKDTFPAVPRLTGVASVTYGATVPEAARETKVVFVAKAKDAEAQGLAAKDGARDPVSVSYETGPAGEVRVLTVSLGPEAKVDAAALRKAATAAVTKLRGLKVAAAHLVLPAVAGMAETDVATTLVNAASLSNYAFERYLTLADKKPSLVCGLHFTPAAGAPEAAPVAEAVRVAAVLATNTIFARDLANERSDEMHPGRLEEVARAIAADAGAEVHVVAGEALLAAKMDMLHAVGQAARHAPRYIELFHKGDPANPGDVLAIVGKGICFDSGGLNLKPTGSMEDMHMDMGGSAAVLGAFRAVTALGLKRNVVCVVAAAENAMDAHSYKPHNILRSHAGLTVEVKNTDAEGRLVLADALSYVQERHRPHAIVDLATLTGACIVGLGEYAAGCFTNSAALKAALLAASEATFERLWPMPLFPEHSEEIRAASMADLQSTGGGRYGGACTAAAFLQFFIGKEQKASAEGDSAAAATSSYKPAWAHLDIAGPAMYSKPRGHMPAGGTGFGVQVVAKYLMSLPPGPVPVEAPKPF